MLGQRNALAAAAHVILLLLVLNPVIDRLQTLNARIPSELRRAHLMYPASLKCAYAAARDLWRVRVTAKRDETRRDTRLGFPMKSSAIWQLQINGLMQTPAAATWSSIKKKISCNLCKLGINGNNGRRAWNDW